jgi:hypothetical protein
MSRLSVSPIGRETLDSPCDPDVARATLNDIARSNLLFGGRASVLRGVRELLSAVPHQPCVTALDVGSGAGDILRAVESAGPQWGIRIRPVAVDRDPTAARMCREGGLAAAVGDGGVLPLATSGVDLVIASQLLHHFSETSAVHLIREMSRVARLGVVVSDLRRSGVALWGIWLASFPLAFQRVTRLDGMVSVRRGFKPRELEGILTRAGVETVVSKRPGFRLLAWWAKRYLS